MKLVNIGFGSMIAAERILAILDPDSAPIKRVVQEAKERGMLIDASFGRKTQTVLVMDSGHVVWSSLMPEQITARFHPNGDQMRENGEKA